MSHQLAAGDFIVRARYCAFVAEIRGDDMVVVPVESAKLGRHRSDIPLTVEDVRIPIMRPVLRCKAAKLVPIERQVPTGFADRSLIPRVMLEIRQEALRQANENAGALGNWHMAAAAEKSTIR